MTKSQVAVVVGWFLLAGYVMWRCFTTPGVGYDIVFAAWCGGVLSTVCFEIVRARRN